jgi:hypothetical protein
MNNQNPQPSEVSMGLMCSKEIRKDFQDKEEMLKINPKRTLKGHPIGPITITG